MGAFVFRVQREQWNRQNIYEQKTADAVVAPNDVKRRRRRRQVTKQYNFAPYTNNVGKSIDYVIVIVLFSFFLVSCVKCTGLEVLSGWQDTFYYPLTLVAQKAAKKSK